MHTCGSLVCLQIRQSTPVPSLPEGLEEALERCRIPIVQVDLVNDPAAPRDVALQIVEQTEAPLSGVARDLISLYDAVAHRKALLVGQPSPGLVEALAPRCGGLLAPLDCCELRHQALEQPESWRALLDSTELAPQRENYLSTLFSQTPRKVSARTLFWVNGSIPSWRAMLTLYEKELPFEARRLRVMAHPKETKSDAYLAINPRGKTPTLLEPSSVTVDESLAILHYLEREYPQPSLLPTSPRALARALSLTQASENLRAAYRPMEALFLKRSEQTEAMRKAAAAAPAAVFKELEYWERYASAHSFIAGDTFTLADCAFYPALAYQLHRGLPLSERFAGLSAYAQRVAQRPAARLAHPIGWGEERAKDLFARAAALGAS